MTNTVYVCPIINTMGPVVDEKHDDLLNNWEEVDLATKKYFSDQFRNRLKDSLGEGVKVSWFPISWSGFKSNPVKRDFGWFTIYDHLHQVWGADIRKYGDGVYWMYNHPNKEGVGNAWGLDWSYGCNYLEIMARMILERGFFPSVIEVPTTDTESENFIENYFPYSLNNRASKFVNWDNIEADGHRTRDVLRWEGAPTNWIPYNPSEIDHRVPGSMKHFLFRLLDIKTRIMEFNTSEIESAFESAMQGYDVILAGYEHDFRDRAEAVESLFLNPINKISKKYPGIQVRNANFLDAARAVSSHQKLNYNEPKVTMTLNKGYLRITADQPLYNYTPFVAVRDVKADSFYAINPIKNGVLSWAIQRISVPVDCDIGIAVFSANGLKSIARYDLRGDDLQRSTGFEYGW